MRHTISVLVENKFGVLARIAGMFSGRGFNIDSLNVAPTNDPSSSRMTIVVRGDDTVLEQVTKQLNKLVDVIEIQDFRDGDYVDRELEQAWSSPLKAPSHYAPLCRIPAIFEPPL